MVKLLQYLFAFIVLVPASCLAQIAEFTAPIYPDKHDLLFYYDSEGERHAVESASEWAIRSAHIRENMQRAMGPLPALQNIPLDVEVASTEADEGFELRKITFISEVYKGVPYRVPAYLLIPEDLEPGSEVPAVLALHPTHPLGKGDVVGLSGRENRAYARELAQRGYVVLAPDYPSGLRVFGDYEIDPYAMGYWSSTMKGIVDHRRGVDLLQSLEMVDSDHIGVIGHSLGGHNALFLAAFDNRLKAVVTSSGFTSFEKYYEGDLTGWTHEGYMPRIKYVYRKDPGEVPFDFSGVVASIAPRPVFVNAPLHDSNFDVSGVRDVVHSARSIYGTVFGADSKLVARYPDAEHDFPDEERREAYAFLDRWLKK